MRRTAVLLAIMAVPFLTTSTAAARDRPRAATAVETREIRYSPPPAWLAPPPAPSATPTRPGAPYRVVTADSQTRIVGEWVETYYNLQIQLLTPEALRFGQLSMHWNPDDQQAIIHKVAIQRGGVETDVLAQRRFTIIQREQGLEQAQLTGLLTGTLQVPGLQVGDELHYVWSHRSRGGVLGPIRFGAQNIAMSDSGGTFRSRITWPADRPFLWRASPDIAEQVHTLTEGQGVELTLTDPGSIVPIEGAPPRFNRFRQIEFSEYPDWQAVSRQFHGLFDVAATITPGSPLDGEIIRIAAQSSDPKARAEAALTLVQDQVRYVFVGLDGGNYRPMSAEQTWRERFGDCKAKTVLLWAMLRKLGIEAEPVLANSSGGDGLDQRLPSPASFDHVLLRATVGGTQYLLDGTRAGERDLSYLDSLAYRWLLPVRVMGADLERGAMQPATRPQLVTVMNVDASAGPDQPGQLEVRDMYLGEAGSALNASFAAAPPDQVTRMLRSYWHDRENEHFKYSAYDWSFDERRQALTLIGRGTMERGWSGSPTAGYLVDLPSTGEFGPNEPERPAEQDQQVPWTIGFPIFRCVAVNIKLPPQRPRFYWDFVAPDLDRMVAGARFIRRSDMRDGVMRVLMSHRTLVPEITAAEFAEIKPAMPAFRDDDAYLVETIGTRRRSAPAAIPIPLASEVDWTGLQTPCAPAASPSPAAPTAPARAAG